MASFGKIEPFSGKAEELDCYLERLEQYLLANDLDKIVLLDDNSNQQAATTREAKRRAVFLSVIGGPVYSVLRNLVSPNKPSEKSFDELITSLKNHYNPAASVAVNRFKFHSRTRHPGESVACYVAELRKLAENCDFGTTLTDMLRDRLVCGVGDNNVQKRLLVEKDLTFDKAYKIAASTELAVQGIKVIQGDNNGTSTVSNATSVMKIKSTYKSSHASSSSQGKNVTSQTKSNTATTMDKGASGNTRTTGYCFRCGDTSHMADHCVHIRTECNFCHKVGHLKKVCLKKKKWLKRKGDAKSDKVHLVSVDQEESSIFHIISDVKDRVPFSVEVRLQGQSVSFQIDTGCGVSIVSYEDYMKFCKAPLTPTTLKLSSYSGHTVEVKGMCQVPITIGDVTKEMPLYVVTGQGPPLLGRSWMQHFKLPWETIFNNASTVNALSTQQSVISDQLEKVLQDFSELFSDGIGLLKDFKAHFEVPATQAPVFCKARPLPFAMKSRVERELEQLETNGVIRRVVHSDWAAPIVPVVKTSGKLRLCGDYKLTINKAIQLDRYPLPQVDDIFANLAGGKYFSKLDLSQAYHQIALDDLSIPLTTVNTHCGLFQYLRLPYGASPCVGLFQRAMENLLKGLSGVSVFLDDILVTGKTESEHLQNLHNVLAVLQNNGLRLQRSKCQFLLDKVEYLGFQVSREGIQPTPAKVTAIKEAPSPTNVSELRAIVGLVNYYSRFIPRLAEHLSPLYTLLQKGVFWKWGVLQQEAFVQIKDLISENTVLAHYDPDAELLLTCDASAVGIGSVLEIRLPDKSTRPIAFASRCLTKPEKHYAQIEREALAIVFGVQKFRQYLLGRRFTLRTDHRPLVTLFGENHGIPQLASSRIKRWSLILSAYSYDLEYISTKDNGCADFLSRAPLSGVIDEESVASQLVLHVDSEVLHAVPLSAQVVASETRKDVLLSKVLQITRDGWPEHCESIQLKPYFIKWHELSVDQGCVLWGNRVIVPTTLRAMLLLDLHDSHIGMVRMKAIARQHFWWPGLNEEIESAVRQCKECQENANLPLSIPGAWNWPSGPWKRLHIDYAGPFMGHMLLVVVDSYTKWLEVFPMKCATSEATISRLRGLFATHGLPEHVVSDNGTNFVSSEFETFLRCNGIKHTTTAPGHPATNGLAERYVGFVKKQLKKMSNSSTLVDNLSRILLTYRTTPHPATGNTPSNLLMKRTLRTRFCLMKPSLGATQEFRVYDHSIECTPKYKAGDLVFALNLRSGARWVPGVIIDVMQRSYSVQVGMNQVWKRHEDQLRARDKSFMSQQYTPQFNNGNVEPAVHIPTTLSEYRLQVPVPSNLTPTTGDESSDGSSTDHVVTLEATVQKPVEVAAASPVRSQHTEVDPGGSLPPRVRMPPAHFKDYVVYK